MMPAPCFGFINPVKNRLQSEFTAHYTLYTRKRENIMIRKLLFDADGTLWDFDASAVLAFEKIFARHGWEYSDFVLDNYNRINNRMWESYERGEMSRDRVLVERFDELLALLGIPFKGADFEDEFRVELEQNPVWMDGAEDLLARLRPDHEIYVVTNGVASTQHKRIRLSGLDRYVDRFFISEEIGAQKPQKAFFDHVLFAIGPCKKEELLLVGDSLSADILGANNAGIPACWFNPAGLPRKGEARPDHEIRSLSEVMAILRD